MKMYFLHSVVFLPPANEVWSKVIFLHLSVSHSVHGGVPGQVPPRQVHPRQVHPTGQVQPPQQVQPPRQVHPPGQVHLLPGTPPWQCMLGYGQQVSGTHPTGMHSCFHTRNPSPHLQIQG